MASSERSLVAPSDLETYYRSIELPFWQAWAAVSHRDDPTGLLLVGFLLCLIPIIPSVISTLVSVIYGRPTIHFWGVALQPSSFWLWWPALATGSFIFALLVGRSEGRRIQHKLRQLSPQQLRFAYCYGAIDEIRRYSSTGVAEHIERADAYLGELVAAMMRASTLDLAEGAYPYHYWQSDAWVGRRKRGEHASIGIRLKLPSWYRLQPETEEIISAFPHLSRLRERAADREDIPCVESALMDLCTFLYTEIMNVPGAPPRAVLDRDGAESLLSFARKVNALPPYRRRPRGPEPAGSLLQSWATLGRWLTKILTHENVIAVFFAWYAFVLVIELVPCSLAFRIFPTLKVDTTLVATLIATPSVVAATALVLSKRPANPNAKN